MTDRAEELLAIRRGFWTINLSHNNILGKLNASDLKILLSGPTHITSNDVLNCIDFEQGDWNLIERRGSLFSMSKSKASDQYILNNVKKYIQSMNENMLRKFLRFATGTSSLPSITEDAITENIGTNNKLRFQKMKQSDRLPEAHTCFNTIELPAYMDYDTLKEKMDLAINGVESGIGLE